MNLSSVNDNVPRIDYNSIARSEFVEKYERPRNPVVLTHAMDHWRAMRKWSLEVCIESMLFCNFLGNARVNFVAYQW